MDQLENEQDESFKEVPDSIKVKDWHMEFYIESWIKSIFAELVENPFL